MSCIQTISCPSGCQGLDRDALREVGGDPAAGRAREHLLHPLLRQRLRLGRARLAFCSESRTMEPPRTSGSGSPSISAVMHHDSDTLRSGARKL